MESFAELGISPALLKSLEQMGFTKPTEIQEKAIPVLLKNENADLVALASTGTGKTAAYGIPLIERLEEKTAAVQALVLSPTRELAMQVSDQLKKLGSTKKIKVATIYGGSSYRDQIQALKSGAQIVVATPGRLVDLLEKNLLSLTKVKAVVLDEADEMLSMGFQDGLHFILSATHPEDIGDHSVRASCPTWLFSATMSSAVRQITHRYLEKPHFIELSTGKGLSPTIRHTYFTVKEDMKVEALIRILRSFPNFYGIIFCQMKAQVADVEQSLLKEGLAVESLHGDKSQKEREATMKRFRKGDTKIIIATDVAARGLDIHDLTHVVNYNLPWTTESYVHRVGRTGRNGSEGSALSLVGPSQVRDLVRVQRQTGVELHKGVFPKASEFALQALGEIFDDIRKAASVESTPSGLRMSRSLMTELAQKYPEINDVDSKDLMAALVWHLRKDLFASSDKPLDFLEGKVPREFEAPGARSSGARSGPRERSEGGFRSRPSSRGSDSRSSDRSGPRAGSSNEGRRTFSANRGPRSLDRSESRSLDSGASRPPRGEYRSEGRSEFTRSEGSSSEVRSEFPRSRASSSVSESRGPRLESASRSAEGRAPRAEAPRGEVRGRPAFGKPLLGKPKPKGLDRPPRRA